MTKLMSKSELHQRIIQLEQDLEKALTKEQQRSREGSMLQMIFDGLPHPTMLIHRDQTIIVANKLAREVGAREGGICWRDFGQSEYIPNEHKNYLNEHAGCIPPEGTMCTFCKVEEAFSSNKSVMEPEINAFGRIWETYWIPISDDIYLHYAIDVTEIKETHRKEADLARIVEESLNEIYIFHRDEFYFVQVNKGARENLGYTMTELEKLTPIDLKPKFTKESFLELIQPLLAGTEKKIIFHTTHKRKDDSLYPVEVHLQLATHLGQPVFVAIILDRSDEEQLQDQLIISKKMTSIAGLAAGVAHEINTPLSGILQSVQIIQMGIDPDVEENRRIAAECGMDLLNVQKFMKKKELDYFLNGIQDSATQAAHITKELLQFSSMHGSIPMQTDLNTLIDRSIELAKADFSQKKELNIKDVEFVRQYNLQSLQVKCRAMEIEQVLINLIKNACQAMVEKNLTTSSQIIIHTQQQGQMAVIDVEDNGPGIKKDIIQQIFDPFFTTKDVGKGSGLGLSVAYSIITDKHGGSISTESTPGKGARFTIKLPIVDVREEING
jgi:PAS domain S-box-containing protein